MLEIPRLLKLEKLFATLHQRDLRELERLNAQKRQLEAKRQAAMNALQSSDNAILLGFASEFSQVCSVTSQSIDALSEKVLKHSQDANLRKAQLKRIRRKLQLARRDDEPKRSQQT